MRIAFFGTPDFAVPTLTALLGSVHEVVCVITQPDRPRGRGQRMAISPVKALALEHGIPVLQPDTLSRDPWEPTVGTYQPDLGVVAAYGKILPDWLLALPPKGLINVHASLLPRYRGASPVHRAVMHGDAETGVTIMRVVKALDAGAMLAEVRLPIGPDDPTDAVERSLANAGARLLVDTVDRLAQGPVPEVPQDETRATYAPRIRKDDGVVDWTQPARAIHNQVRGLHPWPHAFTYGPSGRLIIHRTAVAAGDTDPPGAAPGVVVTASPASGLIVATGSGLLQLLDIQAEGGRVLPARQFLAGHPLPPGTRLGLRVIAPARLAAFDALVAHAGGANLPSALAAARRGLTDPRDQTLATELASGTIRMQRALDFQLARRSTRPLDRLDRAVLTTLRLAAFQVIYLSRVPPSAAVHDAVDLVRRAGKSSAGGLVNAVLRSLAREADRLDWPEGATPEALGVRHSHPDWLVARWLARYGLERTTAWLEFNNRPARLTLAANRARGSREALAARLATEGVETRPTERAPHGLVVLEGAALGTTAFRDGWFVVQDEASQLVASLAGVEPGDRVLDLCASPGGKTVALAAAAQPGGRVVACDVRPRRVRLLRSTLARCGLESVPIVQVPAAGSLPFADAAFDVVLVDAPCSGLGTLRRDPDIRWSRQPEDLERLAAGQRHLVTEAARLVAPGGRLVYATCSSEPEENDAISSAFLRSHPGFAMSRVHRTLPPDDGLEAFYGAVITRNV